MESTVLVKAFGLLETVAAGNGSGQPLGELARVSGLTKPTAHRILQTLVGLGYVERAAPGVYRLSSRARRLAGEVDDRRLIAAAEPILRRLHEQTDETVNLGVLRHGRVVYLRTIQSNQPLRHVGGGDDDPFYSTALGRAIVSRLSEAQREMLLRNTTIKPRTAKTTTDIGELRRTLDAAAKAGYAVEVDQTDLGVTCIGAAVCEGDDPIAAISISAPTVRVGERRRGELASLIVEAAAGMGKQLTSNAS